jgi:hypothetical protein
MHKKYWEKIENRIKQKKYKIVGNTLKIRTSINTVTTMTLDNPYALIQEDKRYPRHRLMSPELQTMIIPILLKRKFLLHQIENYTVLCAKISCTKFTYPAPGQAMYVKPNGERFAVDQSGHVHLEPEEK